jgi:phage N-6-adenine-methyltransferase
MNEEDIELFQSKKTDHWQTPKWIYNYYKGIGYGDPCPLNPEKDALKNSWGEFGPHVFVNPPYSKAKEFLDKAVKEIKADNIQSATFLLFSNTDTRWWHHYVMRYAEEIKFIKGRLKFLTPEGETKNSAMRPSSLINFTKESVRKQQKQIICSSMKRNQELEEDEED